MKSGAAHCCVQYFEFWAFYAGRVGAWRIETRAGDFLEILERTQAFGKQIGDFGLMKEKLAEMAIQIFAVESMVYRSAGNIEAMMSAATGDRSRTR